jgi:hypothetical protein
MKTPSTEVLEVALCQTPLDQAAVGAAGLTAYRLNVKENGGIQGWLIPFHIKPRQNPEKIPVGKAI